MEDQKAIVKKTTEGQGCANCDTLYVGNFCPNCGQSNSTFNKPFRFIVADFAGNIFSFDTRLWNTIKTIFIKPGKMAQDIMDGKRERYMPPFRLYVFVSFIFFLMLNYSVPNVAETDDLSDSFNIDLENDNDGVQDSLKFVINSDSLSLGTLLSDSSLTEIDNSTGIDLKDVVEHPKRYYTQFLRWLSTAMFFLMPLYGFLLWLFFRKTQKHYFGHLILAINQHVFTFLIFILIMAIGFIFPQNDSSIGFWLILSTSIYYFLGAYRLYQRKWSTTLMRLTVVSMIYGLFTLATLIFIVGVTLVD